MLSPTATATANRLTTTERDQCTVTMLKIDVTDKVLAGAEAALQGELDDIEHEARVFPLRASVEEIWSVLRQPIRLTDSLWLLVGPVSVRLQRPNLVGDTLVYLTGLTANPRIVGGPRPDSTVEPLLPPDRSPSLSPALVIQSEGTLPYDVAEAILSKIVDGRKLRFGLRTLTIRHLKPIGLGDGRLAVGLTVSGAAEGTLYGVGHPQIDSTGRLTIPDLALDAGTVSSIGGALHWMIETNAIQEYLRTAVTINLAPAIEKGRALAEKNLNRELGPGSVPPRHPGARGAGGRLGWSPGPGGASRGDRPGEHHGRPQAAGPLGTEGRGILVGFPSGGRRSLADRRPCPMFHA